MYDQTFNTAYASSNGQLDFVTADSNYVNTCLPDAAASYALFPHWSDLLTENAGYGIFTSVTGSAPYRIFNIEWRVQYYSGAGSANFEVRLYEGQLRFDIVYGQVDQGGSHATVGVQKDTGPRFTQFECNAGGLTSSLQLTFTLPDCTTPTFTPSNTLTATRTNTSTVVPVTTATTLTSTPAPAGVLVGHVVWQGPPAQPSARQQLPYTLTLCVAGNSVSYSGVTDAGGFFTVTTGLANGSYNWRIKGPRYLANAGTLTLSSGTSAVEMSLLSVGDADNLNNITVSDFNIMKSAFGNSADLRADFDNNGIVSVQDFALLRPNFGRAGASVSCS